MINGVQAWGVGERARADRPTTARQASTFGNTDNLDQQLPLLAMRGFGQQEDQMVPAAHGNGRRRRRQQRGDDEALCRRLDDR